MMDKLFYIIFEGDTLLDGVTDVFVELAVLILVPFVVVSMKWSGRLNTPVYSAAIKMSSREETRSV